MRTVGWPSELSTARSVIPGTVGHHRVDLVGGCFQCLQIVAVQLDGIFALDAGCGLFDVVLDILGEVEIHAGELLLQRIGHVVGQLFLVHAGGPGIERLQRHEEFGIEKAGRIGAVVGPAMLRDHRFHFRIAPMSRRIRFT